MIVARYELPGICLKTVPPRQGGLKMFPSP
jgi:hypothetical protein